MFRKKATILACSYSGMDRIWTLSTVLIMDVCMRATMLGMVYRVTRGVMVSSSTSLATAYLQFWGVGSSLGQGLNSPPLLLLLLQRSTAVQVRSSVRLMPQNQPSGRGLLPSPTAWSSDQHPVAMLADVSRHTLGRTEGRGLGFGQLVRTHTGKCLKCQSCSDGHSDHNALCAGGR